MFCQFDGGYQIHIVFYYVCNPQDMTENIVLQVVCTLGSTVFTAILLLRVIWAAISYFQSGGNTFNQGGGSFGTNTMQPVL